jgi:ketosteroid isomerase-like protein
MFHIDPKSLILRICSVAAAGILMSSAALSQPNLAVLRQQVMDTERSFARSMADRDHAAFTRHLSEQAVFFSGRDPFRDPLRGKAAVAAAWKPFFDAKEAPFSWEPDQVEVTSDGLLAHSTGPVRDPAGKPIARFNSVWRLEAPGVWRIVFDKGESWEEPPR